METEFVGPLADYQLALMDEFRSIYDQNPKHTALRLDPRLKVLFSTTEDAVAFVDANLGQFDNDQVRGQFIDTVRETVLQALALEYAVPPKPEPPPLNEAELDAACALLESGKQISLLK